MKFIFIFLSMFSSQSKIDLKTNDSSRFIPFSYHILSKKSLQFESLIYDNKVAEIVINKGNERENILFVQRTIQGDIKICKYARCLENFQNRDYIELMGKHYVIDSLYYGNGFNEKSKHICLSSVNCYRFSFAKKSYLVFNILGAFSSSLPNSLVLLFDITNPKSVISYSLGFQAISTMDCFGDFNDDAYIDFAFYEQRSTIVRCYTLKNKHFELIRNKYLTISGNPFQPLIDLKKSYWFFNLRISN